MSDVRLAVQQVPVTGVVPTLNGSLSTADTHQVRNDGLVFLHVINGGGSTCNLTIIAPNQIHGLAIADRAVAVAAGANKVIGPFPPTVYNNSDDDLEITADFLTSVTIAVLHVG